MAGTSLDLALQLAEARVNNLYKSTPKEAAIAYSETSCRDFLAWYMILAGDELTPGDQARLLARSYRSTARFQREIKETALKSGPDYRIAVRQEKQNLRFAEIMDFLSKLA